MLEFMLSLKSLVKVGQIDFVLEDATRNFFVASGGDAHSAAREQTYQAQHEFKHAAEGPGVPETQLHDPRSGMDGCTPPGFMKARQNR